MTNIFGHLNVSDSDYVFNSTVGQQALFGAVQAYIDRINAELQRATSVFVADRTEQFKFRYKLPGGGYLQRRSADGTYASVKPSGSWDVAFPLEDFGASLSGNDVDMAYMTVAELNRHIQTVVGQDINTYRFEMLKRFWKSTQSTFVDPLQGSLSIEGLANGDSVTYPPVEDSDSEATENHYLSSGYAYAAISDTNDPVVTMINELEEHFGMPVGGSEIVCFFHANAIPYVSALTAFFDIIDRDIRPGSNTDVPQNLPNVPGRLVGRHKSGAWISQWSKGVPDTYCSAVHLGVEPPLMERVDPAATGLGAGIQLVAQDQQFPFTKTTWRHRFGLGAANRLNGVAMFLSASGWTTPAAYA